jgi:uncharacterized phage-associated protein
MLKEDILEWKVNGEIIRIPCLVDYDFYQFNQKPIDIMSFVNGIVYTSNSLGVGITNLKLQKLLSEIQLSYKRNSIEIFKDKPEIWRHGLVYPEVYRDYKAWFNDNIKVWDTKQVNKLEDEDLIIIQDLIVEYKDYDDWDMVRNNKEKIESRYFDLILER